MALSSNYYALQGQRRDKILKQKSGSKSSRIGKLWQFLQGHPKSAFSEKVQRGDEAKFFKNRPKRRARLNGRKTLWRNCHYPLISKHLKCKDWKRFRCKQRLQRCPNGQVMAIFARSPKTRIFCKSAKGNQEKFFKNRPKRSPRLKGPKAHWRKWNYPLICAQTLENILAQTAAPKVSEWPSYGYFCEVIQNPHFLKKSKGETKRNF